MMASASLFAFGLGGREREWERDEIRELKDSQAITRMLRRENEKLRIKLERFERMQTENDELRR